MSPQIRPAFFLRECFFGSFFPKSCGCLKVGGAAYTRVFTVSVTFHSINCNQGSYKKSKPFFQDFSRTKLNFQALPTRNVISWTVYKFTFPVQANRYLMLQVFVPSPFLHLSVHLLRVFNKNQSRRQKWSRQRRGYSHCRRDFLVGPGARSP